MTLGMRPRGIVSEVTSKCQNIAVGSSRSCNRRRLPSGHPPDDSSPEGSWAAHSVQGRHFMMKRVAVGALAGAALLFAVGQAGAAEISGAGATFPYPIYAKWADAYKTKTGIGLNYQSIGSGGGIKQIESKTVDFGASDMPLEPKDLDKAGLMQFPMVMGAEVAVMNLKGLNAGDIKLTGSLLADIYLKKITKWNDPALAKLNPGVKLPDEAITVVHRSDGSGTTFIFTHYLSQISPEWKSQVGENTSVQW